MGVPPRGVGLCVATLSLRCYVALRTGGFSRPYSYPSRKPQRKPIVPIKKGYPTNRVAFFLYIIQ
jgi:hypothetical protein